MRVENGAWMPSMRCRQIVLPDFPLSPLKPVPVQPDPTVNPLVIEDADPIIQQHAIHWMICMEGQVGKRASVIGKWRLAYQDVESVMYSSGCDVIIAFRWTKTMKDVYDDLLLTLGRDFPRARQAKRFVTELLRLNRGRLRVQVTGHSLGGAIAREVGEALRLPVITFNGAAPPSAPVVSTTTGVDYHIVFDFVSAWQSPNTVRIDKGYLVKGGLDGVFPAHAFDNFSKKRRGIVVTAHTEDYMLRSWWQTLPLGIRIPFLFLLFGAGGGMRGTLPLVEGS